MAEHPVVGERILLRTQGARAASRRSSATSTSTGTAPATRTASRGHRIPLGSRIILACDAYIAMITSRPYREALTPARRVGRAARAAPGAKFDPEVVDALLDLLGHDAPRPRPGGGVKLAAPTAPRAYVTGGRRLGLGAGRVTSVAE